jgi:hypothetical protein
MRATRTAMVIVVFGMLAACAKERQVPPPDTGPMPGTTEWKIARAVSAAPDAVGAAAAVAEWPASDTAQFAVLRPGVGGWTCFADNPLTPRPDPLCADDQFLRWLTAWRAHAPAPSVDAMAVGYALQGTEVASESDPRKTQPDSGQAWVSLPPSVLIAMPSPASYRGIRTTRGPSGPWVLWAGTPYAIIVVPAAPQTAPPAPPAAASAVLPGDSARR